MLLSLLLAFFVWLIYTLSGEYSAFLEYELVARSEIPGHSDKSSTSATMIIRGKANGFYIIRRRIYKSVPMEIQVSPELWKKSETDDELYYLTEDALRELMPSIGLQNIELEYFVTSRLEFRFMEEEYKKVPVIPASSQPVPSLERCRLEFLPLKPLPVIRLSRYDHRRHQVGQNPDPAPENKDRPQKTNDRRIHIQILADPAADPQQHPV